MNEQEHLLKGRVIFLVALLSASVLISSGTRAEAGQIPFAYPLDGITSSITSFRFVENVGQFDPQVLFYAQLSDAILQITQEEIWLTVFSTVGQDEILDHARQSGPEGLLREKYLRGTHLRLTFNGANPEYRVKGMSPVTDNISYLLGDDPAHWYTSVPAWEGIQIVDLYPGVDMVISFVQTRVDWRLVVKDKKLGEVTGSMGASMINPLQARLQIEGAENLSIQGNALEVWVNDTVLGIPRIQAVPEEGSDFSIINHAIAIEDNEVVIPFSIDTDQGLGFFAGKVQGWINNALKDLLSAFFGVQSTQSGPFGGTPNRLSNYGNLSGTSGQLLYATYLGGEGFQLPGDMAIDSTGSAYLVGSTYSADFPTTPGAFQTEFGGGLSNGDVFVTKFSPDGGSLIYSTFLGGEIHEYGYGIEVGEDGSAYVVGSTNSEDFPITAQAYQTSLGGGTCGSGYVCFDAFITKLNPEGSGLIYSTFLGGSASDRAWGIVVDSSHQAIVIGDTESTDFPFTLGAYQTTYHGDTDVFVAKMNADGSERIFSTYVGGTGLDYPTSVNVDSDGSAYITGYTDSSDYPTTAGAYQPNPTNESREIFVTKLNPLGTLLGYSTYIGGSDEDRGNSILVNEVGEVYLYGHTDSGDFPTTEGSFQSELKGVRDVYILKLDAIGSDLIFSTFLGGDRGEQSYPNTLTIDGDGYIYIAGYTTSVDFPITEGALQSSIELGEGSIFIAQLDSSVQEVLFATYFGGSTLSTLEPRGVAVDGEGDVYLAGRTTAVDFPVTEGAFDTTFGGGIDAYLAKISLPDQVEPTPIAFMDLPIQYEHFADAALSNRLGNNDPSRLNSWFDHAYPNYGTNGILSRWDGHVLGDVTGDNPNINDCILGRSCYDGHNGLDFSATLRGVERDDIYAAAAGVVFHVVENCVENQPCTPYGNLVWIDHGNCYATRYAHLRDVNVEVDQEIVEPRTNPIGTMGATATAGIHLHFDAHYDQDCDGDWFDGETVVIDPYGWIGVDQDPWEGPNDYLWTSPLVKEIAVTRLGANITSYSNFVHVSIPEGALLEPELVELWDSPSLAYPPWQWLDTGRAVGLRVPSWDPDRTFEEPVSITVSFDAGEMDHQNVAQVSIYRWDDTEETWEAFETTSDLELQQASITTTYQGRYELMASRLVPADTTEPDDDYDAAPDIPIDGTAVDRYFDIQGDEDWFALNADAGRDYEIETLNLAVGVGTILEVYDQDGVTLLTSSQIVPGLTITLDAVSGSKIEWRAPYDGTYFIRVSQTPSSISGAEATYQLAVQEQYQIYLPFVIRGDTD